MKSEISLMNWEIGWLIEQYLVGRLLTARFIYARSNTGVVVSNPTEGRDICIYSVFVLSCVGSGLAAAWSSVQGVLPNFYVIKKL
jgi:hypothetical protein